MECNLNLQISKATINKILPDLYKKFETSGIIKVYNNGNGINNTKIIDKNNGESDSVLTPNHLLNYHTHPINAYKNANTVWGWPSGEDIRETIKFALSGNKAHLVFTVEGIYSIQVNACKIGKLKNKLSNEERGILIFLIEEYFKATHDFRGLDELINMNETSNTITPQSYCEFINNFELSNLLLKQIEKYSVLTKSNDEYSLLPEKGFLGFGNNKITSKPLTQFIKKEDLNEIYSINQNGIDMNKINISVNQLNNSFLNIISKLNNCNRNWNNSVNKWFFVNFFPSTYYTQKNYLQKNTFKRPSMNDKINILSEVNIKIHSNKSEGCSIKSIELLNKFESGKNDNNNNNNNINTFGNTKNELSDSERYHLYKIIMYTNGNFFNEQFLINNMQSNNNNNKIKNELMWLVKLGLLNVEYGINGNNETKNNKYNKYIINQRILN